MVKIFECYGICKNICDIHHFVHKKLLLLRLIAKEASLNSAEIMRFSFIYNINIK